MCFTVSHYFQSTFHVLLHGILFSLIHIAVIFVYAWTTTLRNAVLEESKLSSLSKKTSNYQRFSRKQINGVAFISKTGVQVFIKVVVVFWDI